MNQYLKTTYPYDLSIAPQGEDMDAVEYFLFEQRRGYCEQFSSSLAVMARSQGIPARVATGYAPGEYNPFTGLYEIKASDAHAWVEVYFPQYGWTTFDPTPSFDSTPWQYRAAGNLQGGKAFGFIAKRLGEAAGPVAGAAGTLMRGVARLDPVSIIVVGAARRRGVPGLPLHQKTRRPLPPRAPIRAPDQGLRRPPLQQIQGDHDRPGGSGHRPRTTGDPRAVRPQGRRKPGRAGDRAAR